MSPLFINQYQDTYTKPDINIVQYIKEQGAQKQTEILADIPKLDREDMLTTRMATVNEGGGFTLSNQTSPSFSPFGQVFSDIYIEHNIGVVMTNLINELTKWEDSGTDEGLIYIKNIKDTLESEQKYFFHKSESRILISLLQLLFENNLWETLTTEQIRQLRGELARFKDGDVSWDNLEKFSRQMHQAKITPFKKYAKEQKEIKK